MFMYSRHKLQELQRVYNQRATGGKHLVYGGYSWDGSMLGTKVESCQGGWGLGRQVGTNGKRSRNFLGDNFSLISPRWFCMGLMEVMPLA